MLPKLNWHILCFVVFVVFRARVAAGIGSTTTEGASSVTEVSSSREYGMRETVIPYTEYDEHNNTLCNCTHTRGEYHMREHIEEMIRAAARDILDQTPVIGAETEYDVTGDIRDMADTLIIQLYKNINQITEKIKYAIKKKQLLKTIENLKNKVVELNNTSSETCNIVKLLNTSGSVNDRSIVNSMCDVTPPSSVLVSDVIWKKYEIPAEDDLDRYMVNKTGCSYHVLGYDYSEYTAVEASYYGKLWEWRGAVRARDRAGLRVSWGYAPDGYSFTIGQDDITITQTWDKEWRQSTPGILSPDRYVPFYVTIREGKLTFGTDCEREPVFSRDVTIERGALPSWSDVKMVFSSNSYYGSKFLHCPTNVAVVDVELVALLRSYDTRAARLGDEDKSTQ